MTRQEEPVTLPDPSSPRVVLPAPFTTSPGPGPSVQSSAAPPIGARRHGAQEGPHRAHPAADGTDPMARPVTGMEAPPPQPAPSTAGRRHAPAAGCQAGSGTDRNGGGPLSLDPQARRHSVANQPARANEPPAPRQRPRRELASVAPG